MSAASVGDAAAFYVDPVDGERLPFAEPTWRSSAGRPLSLPLLPGVGPGDIATGLNSLWRYAGAFPCAVAEPICLGEGRTPLVARRFDGLDALFKLEWFSPTGSFKDRGASVMLSILRQQGVRAVLEDSSGNGGCAIAAYAAAGGVAATILAPASTQPAKVVQIRAYGAEVELIEGSRDDVAQVAVQRARGPFYASHNWHPLFLHGVKTLAYELWEDLGFRAPDNIVMPCGAGSLVLGCDLGFDELLRRGEIDKRPRIFGIQPANCAPLARALAAGSEHAAIDDSRATLAEGASIACPVRGREVLEAVRRSQGDLLVASEAEIETALFDLARHGLYTEPTSALAAAGLGQLRRSGRIGPEEITVVVLTGTGLKATPRISDLMRRAH